MYRHEDMIKINHDSGLRRVERRRNQAEERVILANEAARKAASRMSRTKLDRIRRKRGEEARERDRPNYDKMHPNKVLAARVFHQLYLLTVKKHKRAIDVFRDFDTDDSGTVDRAEFAAGCVALGMNLGGGKADDEVFDAIDEDGSGELDYWEVEKAIKRAGKYPPPYPKQEVNPQNIVATHFTDMKEGFRAILKFKAKLRKTREEEEMKKSKKLHALKTGQGEESSSSDEEDENKTPSNLQKIMNKRSSDIGISIKKTKTNNTVDDDSEDDYDDDEDQFEDDEEIQEERTPQQKSEVEKLRSKISNQIHVHNSDSDDEPKEYTLKDLAMWVNMDDPAEIINNPAVARAAASVPQAVRRVAAKLHKLMKRERLGIKTMFECLDTDGSGILEVNELHDGLRQYLDIDLSLDELKVVLDHCDKSMDGQISFVEFEKAFLWADMKRMARIVKRQNHADRRHYKMRKRHRNKVAKEKSQCGIYRVPDDVPLPTKEEQASFPNGKPRKLPFWLRPRDSPHSRPWMNKNRIKSDLSCASDGNDSILEDRRTVLRKERHQKRCAKLGVKQTKLSEARKIHHSKVIHASDILSHMDDKSTKNQPTKTKTKTHHREHVKTLPPEIGQPIMPPRITANELEETAKTGVGMMRAIQRRRARVSGGGSQQHDRPKSKQHNSPTAKQRMIDARDLYTTPPVLYGAKDGQGFSTSPPKIRLPQNIKRVSSKQLLLSAMRAVGVLEDKVNAQHLNKACDEIFNFRVVTNEGEDLDLHNNNSMKSTTAVIGEDGVRKQLASWNPERAGIAVSPMDTVDTDIIGLTSPQPYLQYPHKNSAATGRVVLLSRVPRRQLMRKKMLRKRIQSEVEALQRVHGIETNQFIQRTIAVLALPTELIIVNIFPEGGTLRQLLQKRGKTGTLGVNPTRFYAAEVLLAIEFLHKKGILHRDIKLENVQLGANGHIVLGGFSLALPNFTGIEHEIVGSPQCMAPEMITGEGYGRGVDWWGLGVLVHDMLCGESPFNSDSPEELFHQITHANVTLGHQFSKVTKDFVEGLLVRKPQNRLGGANRGKYTYIIYAFMFFDLPLRFF
jgi:Ca2+-binding EF-hand superfamily protein